MDELRRLVRDMNNKRSSKITSVVLTAAMLTFAAACSLDTKPEASELSTAASESDTITAANESVDASVADYVAVTNIHTFENGKCNDCGMLWPEYFYESLGKLDTDSEPGSWHSVYGPDCDAMLDKGDYVQFSSYDKERASAYYQHLDEKFNCESCRAGVATTGGTVKGGIEFAFEEGQNPLGDGTLTYKFMYKLNIDVAPGEFDKVFESKEAFAGSCTLMLCVLDDDGSYNEVWSLKREETIRKMFEEAGCTYYTRDQIIDMFWRDHTKMLESIDYGLNDMMNTSLADSGINWKK